MGSETRRSLTELRYATRIGPGAAVHMDCGFFVSFEPQRRASAEAPAEPQADGTARNQPLIPRRDPMSTFNFGSVVGANAAGITANPEARIARYRVDSRQEEGLRSRVRVRQFTFDVDEPTSLAGTDTAPSPVEYALAALATCQEITYRLHADHLAIPIDSVAVTLEGDLDLRGFFAVDDDVRPGFVNIRGTVTIQSPAPVSELHRLKAHVDAHCPVFDLLSNSTPLELELVTAATPVEAGRAS